MHLDEQAIIERVGQEPNTLGVVVLGESSSAQSIATVEEVLERVRGLGQGSVEVGSPEGSPFGPALFLDHDGDPRAVVAVLRSLAEQLHQAGLTGRITPAETAPAPISDPLFSLWGTAAGMCATRTAPQQNRPPREVVDHALQWCRVQGGAAYIRYGTGEYVVPARARGALLRAALAGEGIVSITSYAADDQVRRVVFFDEACVVYEERSLEISHEAARWQSGVDVMTRVLQDLAPWLDYGLVRRQHFGAYDWSVFLDWEWPQKPHLPTGLVRYIRDSSPWALPDGFGVMVVGSGHAWVPSPQLWSTTPLPGGKRLVRHRDQVAVFGQERPDQAAVARMRTDMTTVLMTEAMLS